MHHVCAPKKMLVGLLALVLGALITGSAAAAGQQVIPYLSHGVGVDQSAYSGTSTKSTKTPLVIPYLSQGHGVDQSLYVGGSHHLRRTAATAPVAKAAPDALARYLARHEQSESTAPVAKAVPDALERYLARIEASRQAVQALRPDDREGLRGIERDAMRHEQSESTAPVVKAVPDVLDRAVARLESDSTTAAIRPDDRKGLRGINATSSGVTSSTSHRPDDRAGSRGIGVTSTVETASSSSSTDWSPAFYAGAGFLGAMLVAGGALALTRRQHGGVATH